MTLERNFWLEVAKKAIVYDKKIEPRRGDILSDNGELLVSDLVRYRIYINFDNINDYNYGEKKKATRTRKKDSIWNADLKKLCDGLEKILPQWKSSQFESHLRTGLEIQRSGGKKRGKYGRKYYPLYPDHQLYLSYPQYVQIMKLPILCNAEYVSGVNIEEHKYRKKFFGSLAYSTLGDFKVINKKKGINDKHGIDEKYDSLLRGREGIMHTEKEKQVIDVPVTHGMNVQTTLNVEMLDICERALRNGLESFGSRAGWVILMEVKTGDIKAIVNLSRNEQGVYEETYRQNKNNMTPNHALADLREPGSIFKPVALSIALEDELVHENDSTKTYGGVMMMHGRQIKDAVRPKRDYQTVTEIIQNSSNIGMALLINEAYKNNPKRFTDKLVEYGMKDNYQLLNCEGTPTFRTPDSKYWSKPDLQAMSRGYATQQTALNMITFYNTIANNGCRMKPRLVKAILKDGEVVENFETEVLDKKMLSQNTVDILKRVLSAVVNNKGATGARAKSDKVSIAGKTGTAVNSKEGNMLSFCGFFPIEEPEYTCIVQNINNVGGGGGTSAVIFKEIAEKIMANNERSPLEAAVDTINSRQPTSKRGNMTATEYILDELGVDTDNKGVSDDLSDPSWGALSTDSMGNIRYAISDLPKNTVPNVVGMGAKDAIYLMSRAGLHVTISGHGKVATQSVTAGRKATRGTHVRLTLKP